ncbi:MAG UNVERIFIED_CONTAM: hypothetical protein LVR29_08325 [Microcystis novacekii LVE1205-3]
MEALVSNQIGQQTMKVSADLYNSSIYEVKTSKLTETVTVDVITLDSSLGKSDYRTGTFKD